jgi:metal-dependent hydrolase (beta-lactamase superfamily II)
MARKLKRVLAWSVVAALSVVILVAAIAVALHRRGVTRADDAWKSHRPAALRDMGSTRALTILPLLDWHTAKPGLKGDMGVSYLIKADELTVLFDTGNNSSGSEPSPLEHNMKALGVALDEIDAVVISHAHFDHTGGRRWTGGKISGTTFGIGSTQPSLAGKTVLTPIPMTYPGIKPRHARDPVRLGHGVATTGTIARKLFVGWIDEQALAVNVQGKGIVLVVGCGHQTVTRLVERVEAVFSAPLYGIIGGLHYPVPDGRMKLGPGINVQRRFASGIGPLAPLTVDEVRAEIGLLTKRRLGVVSLSGHDSSDEAIQWFRDAFGSGYQDLKVGSPIRVGP